MSAEQTISANDADLNGRVTIHKMPHVGKNPSFVPHHVLKDFRLSPAGRMIVLILLDYPEDAAVIFEDIAQYFTHESEKVLRSAISKLIKIGYLKQSLVPNPRGRGMAIGYTVREYPGLSDAEIQQKRMDAIQNDMRLDLEKLQALPDTGSVEYQRTVSELSAAAQWLERMVFDKAVDHG